MMYIHVYPVYLKSLLAPIYCQQMSLPSYYWNIVYRTIDYIHYCSLHIHISAHAPDPFLVTAGPT